jgi:hypothetical protein
MSKTPRSKERGVRNKVTICRKNIGTSLHALEQRLVEHVRHEKQFITQDNVSTTLVVALW